MALPKILFLSPRQCWPARSGAKLREYHFAKALAKHSELTYVHFTDPDSTPLTQVDLPFCQAVVAVPKPPAYGVWNLIRGIAGRLPFPVLNYASEQMMRAVEKLASTSQYDLIHLDSIHMFSYGAAAQKHLPLAKIIYNWHNIESEAMFRFSKTTSSLPRRWYANVTAAKLASLEREILGSGFGHIVCSERELAELNAIAPSARVAVVENGVDADSYADFATQPSGKLVFVGLMDYYPNIEASISFTRNIWPQIRERLPDLSLYIVGANPVPQVRDLGDLPGVTVTGTVPEIRPYYQDAFAAIVPLRTGGGTRLKILEAMAAGVPVISTPLGAEGLAVTAGENILLAPSDDAGEWIRHLTDLAGSETARARLTTAALQLARARYNWEALGEKLWRIYESWLGKQS